MYTLGKETANACKCYLSTRIWAKMYSFLTETTFKNLIIHNPIILIIRKISADPVLIELESKINFPKRNSLLKWIVFKLFKRSNLIEIIASYQIEN